jgi:hypothetical protein
VYEAFYQISLEQLKEAAKEEVRLAVEARDVDKNGIPVMTVLPDGTWSKLAI